MIKKQWGQNLIKFQGVMLPGGIQLNGRQIYDDAVKEIEEIEYSLKTEYEFHFLRIFFKDHQVNRD